MENYFKEVNKFLDLLTDDELYYLLLICGLEKCPYKDKDNIKS